jgi:hypothetical protein
MPRPSRAQSTIFDEQISDPDLEKLLAKQLKLEPEGKDLRATKKLIRARIENQHAHVLEESDANGNGKGWVVCGPFRFKPRKTEREEGEVKIGAGVNWSCPVERV